MDGYNFCNLRGKYREKMMDVTKDEVGSYKYDTNKVKSKK